MSTDYPRFVFKDGGPKSRAGGSYDELLVKDADQHQAALDKGWYENLPDAVLAAQNKPAEIEQKSPKLPDLNRTTLEWLAQKHGVSYHGNLSDKKLREKIMEEAGDVLDKEAVD